MTDGFRARALAQHNMPRYFWSDSQGAMHFRCITDEPNSDCIGCNETATPPPFAWRYDPPPPPEPPALRPLRCPYCSGIVDTMPTNDGESHAYCTECCAEWEDGACTKPPR
jgi:hypothetical protein